MEPSYIFWLTIFGIVGYMMVVDKNVEEFITVFFLGVWVQLKKYYYMVKLRPFWVMNPIGRWWMMRKYRKMAEEMLAKVEERLVEAQDEKE